MLVIISKPLPPIKIPHNKDNPRELLNRITFHHPLNRFDYEELLDELHVLSKPEKKLLSKYDKEICNTQGFDITHYTGPYLDFPITPFNIQPPETMKAMKDMATTAIQKYNKQNRRTKYEVLEIDKANIERLIRGIYYYITFKAKERKQKRDNPVIVRIFQAQVLDTIQSKEKIVVLVRLKKNYTIRGDDDEKLAAAEQAKFNRVLKRLEDLEAT